MTYPHTPTYYLTVHFDLPFCPAYLDCQVYASVENGQYHPVYLARVTLEPSGSIRFTDAVTLSAKTCREARLSPKACPPKRKVIEVLIDAGWKGTSLDSTRYKLSKHSPASTANDEDFETKWQFGSDANHANFKRYYSPALGMNDTSWVLSAYSSGNRNAFISMPPKVSEGPGTLRIDTQAVGNTPPWKAILILRDTIAHFSGILEGN
jgi:hypothetical protein